MPCITCKGIPGFLGYRACPDGFIQSRWNTRWGLGKVWTTLRGVVCQRGGYFKITLRTKNGLVQRYVHQLVLLTFVGPCPQGRECLHRDGNPQNNCLSNLAWGTRSENRSDAIRHGTFYTPFRKPSKLSLETIKEIQNRHALGESTRSIAGDVGVSHGMIWNIVSKRGIYKEG